MAKITTIKGDDGFYYSGKYQFNGQRWYGYKKDENQEQMAFITQKQHEQGTTSKELPKAVLSTLLEELPF